MRRRGCFPILPVTAVLFLAIAVLLYNLPPVYEPIDRYTSDYRVKVHRLLNPPEELLFNTPEDPEQQIAAIVQATLQAVLPVTTLPSHLPLTLSQPTQTFAATGASPTNLPTLTAVPATEPIPDPTATLTPAGTPLPGSVALTGFRNEIETRNNCGPATLAMLLSHYGWEGDQTVIQDVLRPNRNVDDKNVMPAELVRYVHEHTGLSALVRSGGDLDTLRRLIAGGFPVLIEKGHITTGWIGHYILLTGYDDAQQVFFSQDSLIVANNTPVNYGDLTEKWWRHFNYLYLVVYPPEREGELLALLGPQADPSANFAWAGDRARLEIERLQGRELFFAWYNLGSSLVGLQDWSGAAAAYDTAFGQVYPALDKDQRPWRVLWYQTGPYEAYYHSGRYEDVIRLADTTLLATGNPVLEETFYWRGLAREALGDQAGAVEDFQAAARLNPHSTPVLENLERLGLED